MSENSGNGVGAPPRGSGRFGWSRRRVDGAEVIFLAGELDLATAAELRRRLLPVVESSAAATIVLDLSGVRFVDAHTVDVIVAAWKSARGHGRQLQVAGLHGGPALVFNVLGLEPILTRPTAASDGGRITGERASRAGGVARRRLSGGAHATG